MAHLELDFELDDNHELTAVRYHMDTPEELRNGVFVQGLAMTVVGTLRAITPDEETFAHAIDLFNEQATYYAERDRVEDIPDSPEEPTDTPTEEES